MVTWAVIGGWIMGSAFYLCFLRTEVVVLLFGVPPAILSGLAVARATRKKENAASVIVADTVVASLICPLVTLMPFAFFAVVSEPSVGIFGALIGGSVLGTLIAAPLGVLFGVIYSAVWRSLERGRACGYAGSEVAWSRFGLAFFGLGGLLLIVDLVIPSVWSFDGPSNVLQWLALGTLGYGVLMVLAGLVRSLRRRRVAERIRRGKVPGWAFVPLSEVPDAAQLPRLFAGGRADLVLVRRSDVGSGPFRSSEPFEPVARS